MAASTGASGHDGGTATYGDQIEGQNRGEWGEELTGGAEDAAGVAEELR